MPALHRRAARICVLRSLCNRSIRVRAFRAAPRKTICPDGAHGFCYDKQPVTDYCKVQGCNDGNDLKGYAKCDRLMCSDFGFMGKC